MARGASICTITRPVVHTHLDEEMTNEKMTNIHPRLDGNIARRTRRCACALPPLRSWTCGARRACMREVNRHACHPQLHYDRRAATGMRAGSGWILQVRGFSAVCIGHRVLFVLVVLVLTMGLQ